MEKTPITREWLCENAQRIDEGSGFWLKEGPYPPFVLIDTRKMELLIWIDGHKKLSFTGVQYVEEVGELAKFCGVAKYLHMFGYRETQTL